MITNGSEIYNLPCIINIDDCDVHVSTVTQAERYGWAAYVPPTQEIPLTDRQAQAWLNIKAERDRRKNGGVFVSDKWFHTDTESRIQWLGLVIMGAAVPPIQWKTMDGTFITLSQALVGAVFQSIVLGDSTDFANAEMHRATMLLSNSPESYDYYSGWRAVYEATP